VSRHGDKWIAYINYRGRHYHLGLFDDEVEAARARDRKAWELHGEFAYLNFPEEVGTLKAAARRASAGKGKAVRPMRRRPRRP